MATPSAPPDVLDNIVQSYEPLVARYGERNVVIQRHTSYERLITSLKSTFPSLEPIANERIFVTTTLPDRGEEKIEITPDLWAELVPSLREIQVETREPHPSEDSFTVVLCVNLRDGTHKKTRFRCKPETRVGDIMETIAANENVGIDDLRPTYGGARISMDVTLAECGIEDGDHIDVFPTMKGRKPVIYLLPPRPLENVDVRLSLAPAWEFTVVYPFVKIKGGGDGQSVSWTVSAKPDGTLTERSTNTEVSYLYWEAQAKPERLVTPPNSRPSTPLSSRPEAFDPSRPQEWLTPESSVVVKTNEIPAYLDAVLKALTLHTEARTSFITFWLPYLQKYAYIALRFLPQAAYEESAPLSIEPKPDVVTRIFMIFQGISGNDEKWTEARTHSDLNLEQRWRDAVGVDSARALNTSLFRVLEWGGMEIIA
ncbi:hypothetical protein SCHPADRAFT_905936 [Schizopora paradoxa]|uniref:Ubiquitin-like domain-containing protein n=1 Tax=Schizopora paradoxa TaxID=27342 RepID=A0A0H2RHU6_9AGAM|nr:hypothetical protein SCHPADRAFT_905936 [Schizopora paradoxa]